MNVRLGPGTCHVCNERPADYIATTGKRDAAPDQAFLLCWACRKAIRFGVDEYAKGRVLRTTPVKQKGE